jgi:REP element-mobilizing transposase RayT
MHHDPEKPGRRSIRLPCYDYRQAGAYFVTLCAYRRLNLFGEIVGNRVKLNPAGMLVRREWRRTESVRRDVTLDASIVMPNHIHGIVILAGKHASEGATRRVVPTLLSGSLGAIIGQFKSVTAKRINRIRRMPSAPVWQRNYFERIIRSEEELGRIRRYIILNPVRWAFDHENPDAQSLTDTLPWENDTCELPPNDSTQIR